MEESKTVLYIFVDHIFCKAYDPTHRNRVTFFECFFKQKRARRKEDQALTDKEESKKKTARKFSVKRSRSKGRCELGEQRVEKEVKIRRKLKAESAEHESISDTDL